MICLETGPSFGKSQLLNAPTLANQNKNKKARTFRQMSQKVLILAIIDKQFSQTVDNQNYQIQDTYQDEKFKIKTHIQKTNFPIMKNTNILKALKFSLYFLF